MPFLQEERIVVLVVTVKKQDLMGLLVPHVVAYEIHTGREWLLVIRNCGIGAIHAGKIVNLFWLRKPRSNNVLNQAGISPSMGSSL